MRDGVAIGVLNLMTAEEESVKQEGDGGEGIFFLGRGGKTADRLSVEKLGEKWERDLIEMRNELFPSWQRASVSVCPYVCVCIPLSIKVSGASYFSSAAGDVRTSSALFPALAPGEFITSSSLAPRLAAGAVQRRKQRTRSAVFPPPLSVGTGLAFHFFPSPHGFSHTIDFWPFLFIKFLRYLGRK